MELFLKLYFLGVDFDTGDFLFLDGRNDFWILGEEGPGARI